MPNVFISLGDHCTVGFAIRKFFKTEPSSCFDWLITPTNALIDILNTKGEMFGLRISHAWDINSVMCESYGCFYHHEFDRNEKGNCVITPENLRSCRDKLIHKYNKMVGICKAQGSFPLFIRNIHPSSYPENGDKFVYTADKISAMMLALENTIQHKNFKLIFTTVEKPKCEDFLIEDCDFVKQGRVLIKKYAGDYSENSVDLFWKEIFLNKYEK
jgi:hypothetical protein